MWEQVCLFLVPFRSQLFLRLFDVFLDLVIFSAPDPKAQVHYCDHALSVVRPSVRLSVCLSSVRRYLFTFSTSPLKPLNGIQRNLIGSKDSTSSTKFVFFGPIGKTRWPPWPLIGRDIFDFSSETVERNLTKLDRKQDLNILYRVCVFEPIGKTRWPPWPLIG